MPGFLSTADDSTGSNSDIVSTANPLPVMGLDFGVKVSLGLVPHYKINTKFGRNIDIDTSTVPEDIWGGGGNYPGFNATANQNIDARSSDVDDQGLLVSSGTATETSATALIDSGATFLSDGVAAGDLVINDTQALHGVVTSVDSETKLTVFSWVGIVGAVDTTNISDVYRVANANDTGAAVVRLERLLNANFVSQLPKYLILNGTSGVTATGDYIRCSRARVILAGSSGTNEGEITVRQITTTANIFSVMPIGNGKTQICCDTVPAGTVFFVKHIEMSITRSGGLLGAANFRLNVRPYGQAWIAKRNFELQTGGPISLSEIGSINMIAGTDFKVTAFSVSDSNTIGTASIESYELTV